MPFASAQSGAVGKIPEGALDVVTTHVASGPTKLTTKTDGAFQFSGVQAPGYYLLTASKPGFQTQKFLIDSTDLASPTPLKIAMAPATGTMSGTVTDKSGNPIGAATITVTDGTVSLQTSSVSSNAQGKPGSWLVNGVSTPGTYLVTASAPGYGTESAIVPLNAGGKGSSNLKLSKGVGAIIGTVSGDDGSGRVSRLGGITVTATNGTITSTATTVTAGPVGTFTLPDLPVPGDYIVTISGDGYQTQTRSVTFGPGVGEAAMDVTLILTQGRVTGIVSGKDVSGHNEGPEVGVGLTLTNSELTFKTMTTSAPEGQYDFTGVPPGTYVLTASQFGRIPSSATVHVVAAKTSKQNLTLVASSSTVLPASSYIKGSVADSRASGPLPCDRTAVPLKDPKTECFATVTVSNSQGAVLAKVRTDPHFGFTIPDQSGEGLTPGLYTLTVTAPGYEPTVQQVPLGQAQTLPIGVINLPVLGLVSGTITTRVGTPQVSSCVVAIPTSTTVTTPPTSCSPSSNQANCTVPKLGTLQCGLTSAGGAAQAPAGTYAVRGLIHGAYQMVVIPRDSEYQYVITNLPTVTIALGGDAQFNAVLDRLGRVQLSVKQANQQTGQLDPAVGAHITVRDSSGHSQSAGTTADDGSALITRLNGTYTVTVSGTGGTATASTGPVGLNQTVNLPMTMTHSVGPFVGRITTTGVTGSSVGVEGAGVTITGTVDYNGSTAVAGTAVVTTDTNGCYAILPAGYTLPSGVTLTSDECPHQVPASSTAVATNPTEAAGFDAASFRVDRITVAVAALGKRTEALPTTATAITGSSTVRVVPTFEVNPQPVDFGNQQLSIAGPPNFTAPDLSTAAITVLSKPGLAGPVSLAAVQTTPGQIPGGIVNSKLTFTDSSIAPRAGLAFPAMPGRYSLQITLPGFVTAKVDLLCPLGDPGGQPTSCVFVKPGTSISTTVRLNELPSVTGSMTAPALPTTVANPTGQPDWPSAVVRMVTGPSNLGNLAMAASPTDDFEGIVTFSGATSAVAQAGGKYTFTISVPGYATENVTVTCGADFTSDPVATFGCTPLTPATGALTRLPAFEGTLTMSAPVGVTVLPTTGTVTAVDTVNPSNTITVTILNDNGDLEWTDAPQPPGVVEPGSYAVTYSAPGFATQTVTFNCNAGASCGPGPVTIKMLPQIAGTVTLGGPVSGITVDQTAITLGAQHPPNVGAVTVTVDGTGAVSYVDANRPAAGTNGLPGGLALPGTYSFNVSLPGYASTTVTVTCGGDYTAAGPAGRSGQRLQPADRHAGPAAHLRQRRNLGHAEFADLALWRRHLRHRQRHGPGHPEPRGADRGDGRLLRTRQLAGQHHRSAAGPGRPRHLHDHLLAARIPQRPGHRDLLGDHLLGRFRHPADAAQGPRHGDDPVAAQRHHRPDQGRRHGGLATCRRHQHRGVEPDADRGDQRRHEHRRGHHLDRLATALRRRHPAGHLHGDGAAGRVQGRRIGPGHL